MSDSTLSWLSSIDDVIEDARHGRMFILVDDEGRENEGDLVIPAEMANPDVVNFMAKHGRGLICLSMTRARPPTARAPSPSPSTKSRAATTSSRRAISFR